MAKRERAIQVVGSASMLIKNVSSLFNTSKGTASFSVVHKSLVNVVNSSLDGSSHTQNQYVSKEPVANGGVIIILQAKLVQMGPRVLLVLCTQRGIQIFEADGAALIYWHALEDSKNDTGASAHARGICSLPTETLCVGCYQGHILVFTLPSKGTNVVQNETLKVHTTAVCDLVPGSQKQTFVSSDESGQIIVWKRDKTFKPMLQIAGTGYPCSCIAAWKDVVIGGYGSGHIRVYSAISGKIAAEVTAHARWITGLDVTSSGMLLSTSDDTFARVWQLKEGNPYTIEHRLSENVSNLQLVGGCFSHPDGRGFCVAGYDSNELHFYGL